ncbi:ParA family protein [Tautonia rosea]|uniref:ParA family protein n=1 Tax=Tautonia rosea TaxID=2728037 RepID=UPI001474AB80|nr:ParA family protein [Tautonia rosea]
MARLIAVFNNKGGVGKTVLTWNIADTLARNGRRVLLIDFDPQCNLSIAVLGEGDFVSRLPTQNAPYGTTLRAYLQRFLQNTGGEELFLHRGPGTHRNVQLLAGDFWLNVYADSLNVGADLLSGTGLAKYVVLRNIVREAEEKAGHEFDYAIIDLPPSFGALVRATFYSSDYFIVPCTSDNFSVYCVGLIGHMIPNFVQDWQTGLSRFKSNNPHYTDFDELGRPAFAGWIFNGFDTARERRSQAEIQAEVPQRNRRMARADETFHERLTRAIDTDLVSRLRREIRHYDAIAPNLIHPYMIGDIEDANVLIQNSLWQNIPLGQLNRVNQLTALQNRTGWSHNQLEKIELFREKFADAADCITRICT